MVLHSIDQGKVSLVFLKRYRIYIIYFLIRELCNSNPSENYETIRNTLLELFKDIMLENPFLVLISALFIFVRIDIVQLIVNFTSFQKCILLI